MRCFVYLRTVLEKKFIPAKGTEDNVLGVWTARDNEEASAAGFF